MHRAAHPLKHIDEVNVALGGVDGDVVDANATAADGRGGEEIGSVGRVGLDGVRARLVALAAGDTEGLVILVLDDDTKRLHDRHGDVDVLPLELPNHLDLQAVVGAGSGQHERGEKLAALAGVDLRLASRETTRQDDHRQAAVVGLRAHIDAQTRECVEQIGDWTSAAHGLIAVDDKGAIPQGDVTDQ